MVSVRSIFLACVLCLLTVVSLSAEPKPLSDNDAKKKTTPGRTKAKRKQEPETKGPIKNAPGSVYKEFTNSLKQFQDSVRDYRNDVAKMVEYQVKRREQFIIRSYQHLIGKIEVEEHKRRLDAIAYFRLFLSKYRDHPKYTPDAMFRLAELLFEKSYVEYYASLESYDKRVALYEKGKIPAKPSEPKEDYRPSVALYRELIQRWGVTNNKPYRHLDGAYYLLGYCLLQMGKEKNARDAFATLIQRTPKSKFVAEAWLRIGEYHFDHNELAKAIAGYAQVLKFESSRFFDKALYKLAWTYYRKDDYPNAIEKFKQLLRYAEKRRTATGKFGSELRSEAIEYLSVSCVEDDWNGDGVPDADAGVDRCIKYFNGKEKFEFDVFESYADLLFSRGKYKQAIRVYKLLIEWDPLNDKNVRYQSQIIGSYDRIPDRTSASKERVVLAQKFGKNSRWYNANRDKISTIQQAVALVEKSLMQSALFQHEQAQKLKNEARTLNKPELLAEALKAYQLAATAYQVYLKKFPTSPKFYEMSYFYAEALFWSYRYERAAIQYGIVRDFPTNAAKYLDKSAFNAIKAWELQIETLVKRRKLPKKALLSKDMEPPKEIKKRKRKGRIRTVHGEPIPATVKRYIADSDKYVGLEGKLTDASRIGQVAYNIAVLYYRFKHFEEAKKRFLVVIDRWPKKLVASYAARNVLNMYRIQNDWTAIQKYAQMFADKKIGSAEERQKLQKEIKIFKIGALFKKAEKFYEKKDFKNAAKEYVRLITENPNNRFIDQALFNAARSYEKIRHWDEANRMYRKMILHPKVKDSNPLKQHALFSLAENSKKFFNFQQAVDNYKTFYEKYGSDEKRGPYAMFQSARLTESLGRYEAAARMYTTYAEKYKSARAKEAAAASWRAAQLYERQRNVSMWMATYNQFISDFGSDTANNAKVMQALAKFAAYYHQQNQRRKAIKAYERILSEYKSRKIAEGSDAAIFAAEAKFMLVEYQFIAYQAIKLSGPLAKQKKQLKQKIELLKKLELAYSEVITYKVVDWILAALFRVGHLYQLFAEMMYKAPIPKNFTQEEKDNYQTQLEDAAIKYEDTAVARYEKALAAARRYKVVNAWTKKILESLNKYKPAKYRLFKEEKQMWTTQPLFHTLTKQ